MMSNLTSDLHLGRVPSDALRLPLLGAVFFLCSYSIFQLPLNHDVSWLLDAAKQVRAGARLYVDIIELNPPLIVWLKIPVSTLADLLGYQVGTVFRLLVLALSVASIGFSAYILRGRLGTNAEWSLLFFAFYAAIGAAGYDFGQREHLALLLSLPYLATSALRTVEIREEGGRKLITAGIATIGFALKPYFLLVPILVEGLIFLRGRRTIDASVYVMAGVLTAYLFALLLFSPEYIPLAKMVSRVYGIGYLGGEIYDFLFKAKFQIAAFLLVLAWLIRPYPRCVFHVLSAAAIAFSFSAVIQGKAWTYHWYPTLAYSWILFGLVLVKLFSRKAIIRQPSVSILTGAFVVALSMHAFIAAPGMGANENPYPASFSPVIKALGGGPVMIFSNALRVSYPLVTEAEIGSSSRLPTIVLLSAAINSKDVEFETYLRNIVVSDMLRRPPRVIVAEIGARGLPDSFDFVAYLSQDDIFASEMKRFRPVMTIGRFQFFQRIEP